jgi:hypothetical protein
MTRCSLGLPQVPAVVRRNNQQHRREAHLDGRDDRVRPHDAIDVDMRGGLNQSAIDIV